jgi:hypothetical protein
VPLSNKLYSVSRAPNIAAETKIIIKIVKLLDVCALSYCFERKNALLLQQLMSEDGALVGVIAITTADAKKLPNDKIVTKTHCYSQKIGNRCG